MNKLTFVHLGGHLNLARLPDVAGLTNLRSITLARLEAVTTLPSDFARLRHLETMLVLMMPNLKAFPDLSRSRQALKTLVIDVCPLCCDGFLQSVCDLHSASCGFQNSQETASLTCLPAGLSATAAMLDLFNTFNSTICVQPPKPPSPEPQSNMDTGSKGGDSSFPLNSEFDVALEQRMLQCGGILYRECKLGSELSAGICSSDHYMPISCIDDPSIIEFRRQQIKKHFGPPCDSKYEGWLGCISS
ncbi:unnamed protein product [Phytophthora lilii]|uniref:Unnamed protein product n=1 Tax=Phytophthora lilii TaxID=2077276 RepID=A0A9W6TDK8_9STRA|nr:unnamed protein product [Phytophthora lilii]